MGHLTTTRARLGHVLVVVTLVKLQLVAYILRQVFLVTVQLFSYVLSPLPYLVTVQLCGLFFLNLNTKWLMLSKTFETNRPRKKKDSDGAADTPQPRESYNTSQLLRTLLNAQ